MSRQRVGGDWLHYFRYARALAGWVLLTTTVSCPTSDAAIQGFTESFDGMGPFTTLDGAFEGLDVAGWNIEGDGELRDGGYVVTNYDEDIEGGGDHDIVSREMVGRGSFRSYVEIREVDIGNIDDEDPPTSIGLIQLSHAFGVTVPGPFLTVGDAVAMLMEEGKWALVGSFGEKTESAVVTPGDHISLAILYDDTTSEVTFVYDSDIDDELPGFTMGPFAYPGEMRETWTTQLGFSAAGTGRVNGKLDHWSMSPLVSVLGDFNHNGILDAGDIDQLSAQLRAGMNDPAYDLNADALVNDLDRQVWVHDLKQTWFGDADLNGTFDSRDLVQVLASGEYEDRLPLNSIWLTGDWDGNGEFTSSDLITALADGGYEAGPRAAVVPESAGLWSALAGIFALVPRIAKRRRWRKS